MTAARNSSKTLTRKSTILVRELHAGHRERIRAHLIALCEDDRLLRFGMIVTDSVISDYVDSINFARDSVFAVFDEKLEILGMAHLAYQPVAKNGSVTAEFGVSVSEEGRGFGVGTALFERAFIHGRNTKVDVLYVHCLSSNAAMMHIARKAGMSVEFAYGEADAYLRLPPGDKLSLKAEAIQEEAAEIDYTIKKSVNKAKSISATFWEMPALNA
jgi:RimJ/RimL family protein N-acetyltransferase